MCSVGGWVGGAGGEGEGGRRLEEGGEGALFGHVLRMNLVIQS